MIYIAITSNLNKIQITAAIGPEEMKEEINHLPQFLRSKRQTITYSKRVNYVDAVQAFVVRYYEVINFVYLFYL